MDANLCWQTSGNVRGAVVVCEEVGTVCNGNRHLFIGFPSRWITHCATRSQNDLCWSPYPLCSRSSFGRLQPS
jgi:hypothetical protein